VNFTLTSVTPGESTVGEGKVNVSPSSDCTSTIPLSSNQTYTGIDVGNAPVIVMVVPPPTWAYRGVTESMR